MVGVVCMHLGRGFLHGGVIAVGSRHGSHIVNGRRGVHRHAHGGAEQTVEQHIAVVDDIRQVSQAGARSDIALDRNW